MSNKNIIIVEIKCSVNKVFAYTTDPQNTPKWIHDIAWESRSQEDVKAGTIYKNQNIEGDIQEFLITEIEKDKIFALKRLSDGYICVYHYTQVRENLSELKYEEWNPDGKYFAPMSSDYFQILKKILESDE